jgi:hypothetical protein
MDSEDTGLSLQSNTNENFIKDECARIAAKMLPRVENALEHLFDVDPIKGIIAWEKVTEFSISKKRERPAVDAPPALQPPSITINMIPAERAERKKNIIDISSVDAEIIED